MKIAFILGTRPEILKMYPIIRESQNRNIPFVLVHTNQHYSASMDAVFFEELKLPPAHYNLNIGSAGHNEQIGKMLLELDKILQSEKPDYVIVQGDTNSTLAGALAASKLGIKVCHVEAGLRSYDRSMPEEINRIITDSISDLLFAVTNVQKEILLKEGVDKNKIFAVGNTVVDTLNNFKNIAIPYQNLVKKFGLGGKEFLLLTLHRPSNVDDEENLRILLDSVSKLSESLKINVLWPIHPRTQNTIERFQISLPKSFIVTEPLGYIEFTSLMTSSKMILTDSGGIQEEACILKKPCMTLRENTERPETVDVGANILVGSSFEKMQKALKHFDKFNWDYENPFGDGKTSARILDQLQ